jgi:uncharacterized protein YbaP (TraB family)
MATLRPLPIAAGLRRLLTAALTVPALLFALPHSGTAQEPAPPAAEPTSPKPAAERGRPFLYEVRGHGATAYLFGTLHLPDKRVLALPPSVEHAFGESDVVVTEVELTPAVEQAVQRAQLLPDGQKLGALVPEEVLRRVHARLVAAGLPSGVFDTARPWAVASSLPLLPILREMLLRDPLDKALFKRALKEKKVVRGLETVEEQLGVFSDLSEAEQALMLVESLDLMDQYERDGLDPIETLVAAWLSGDEGRLLELLEEGFGNDPELSAKLERRLLWERNVRMAERIHAAITAEPAKVHFFAMGALHLPDPKLPAEASAEERAAKRGLVTLLAQHGYTVERAGLAAPTPATTGKGEGR